MQELQFKIKGSSDTPYSIRIVRREDGNLSAYCTCQAADNGLHCKHRIGVLSGKPAGVVGDRSADLKIVQSWVKGSDIEAVMLELQAAEDQLEEIKTKVARLKKTLARAMLD